MALFSRGRGRRSRGDLDPRLIETSWADMMVVPLRVLGIHVLMARLLVVIVVRRRISPRLVAVYGHQLWPLLILHVF